MQYIYTSLIVIFSSFYLAYHLRTRHKGTLSISDFFVFFVFFQLGPLVWFYPNDVDYGKYSFTQNIIDRFLFGLVLMYVFLTVGMAFGRSVIFKSKKHNFTSDVFLCEIRDMRLFNIIFIISFLFFVLLISSSSVRAQLSSIYGYTFNQNNIFSYNELRREIFGGDSFLVSVVGRLRYSITAVLFCTLISISMYYRRRRIAAGFLCILIFSAGAISFSKLPFVWYIVYCSTIIYIIKSHLTAIESHKSNISINNYVFILSALVTFGAALLFLYYNQYKHYLGGNLQFSDIIKTLVFRLFRANADTLKFYYEHYPDYTHFLGGGSSWILSMLFGVEHAPPGITLPHIVYNQVQTTWPAPFIGDAYADFGYIGIIIYSTLVGLYVEFLNFFVSKLKSPPLKISYIVLCGINTAFFFLHGANTALLTGGLGLFPVLIWGLDRIHLLYESYRATPIIKRVGM